MEDTPVTPVEIVTAAEGTLEQISRAEIDVQIATAHKFPRSIEKFKKRAIDMVTMDEETAESCIYRRPVGKEGGRVKYAEGLSIRTAEIAAACYGNIRIGARIVLMSEREVRAQGVAHDLETNNFQTSEVVEATVKKDGTPYDERMRVVIAKAALAKARRDATFMVIPKALCRPIEAAARKIIAGEGQTLEKRRAVVIGWIAKLGIDANRVWTALGIKGEADIGEEALVTLTGIRTALKEGSITLDEAFPPVKEVPKATLGDEPTTADAKAPKE